MKIRFFVLVKFVGKIEKRKKKRKKWQKFELGLVGIELG